MLRWTVRAHDSGPRFLGSQTLRLSRSQFSCTNIDATILANKLAKELDAPAHPPLSAHSHLTGSQDALHPFPRSSTANAESRDHYRRARFRASSSAIDDLRRYLSTDNATSDCLYSPTIIRSLYYRMESRNQLGMLDSKMLTILMGLFGSLSIDPHSSIVYRVPLASHLFRVSPRRTHWPFVRKVGKYKIESGMPLHDSDRFWLMRAELAIVRTGSPSEPLSNDTYSAILRARIHYHVIRRHSHHPELHAYYLETLLTIRDSRLLDLAAHDLSFLLRTYRICHPWLQRLLYCLVIRHGEGLSIRSREIILAALWGRICRGTDETSSLVRKGNLSDMAMGDWDLDATTIAHSVSAALFGFADHLLSDSLASLPSHLLSVFSPLHALHMRWTSLVLLSIFNSSKIPYPPGTCSTSVHAMPQVISCWQVIFGLASVEKTIQVRSAVAEMQSPSAMGVLEATRTLYWQWLPIVKSSVICRDLACVIATSFLGIASALAEATLFHDCQDLYRMENSSQSLRTSALNRFATQYIAAAVRVQGAFPDTVLTILEALTPDRRQQHLALTSTVEFLARIDPSLAYSLYEVGQAIGMESDPGAAHTLAVSLAHHGALRQAVLFLNDNRFSLEARGTLISAIARRLREHPRARHPTSIFSAVVEGVVALYQSHAPPEHFRGHLEQLLVDLARHHSGRQVFRVVLSIFRRSPDFFRPRFFDRYCRALIRHGQLSTASQLLDAIITTHPRIARSLFSLTNRVVVRSTASRMFSRAALRNPASLKLSSRLRRYPYTGPLLERSLWELLNSGRVFAAKRTFACVAGEVSPSRSTTLGNILICGVSHQPTARNGRRVRKVLTLLEDLVKNHSFQPDRVTVNILIKVMISWRSAFDSSRLRNLFDHLVREGYPAGAYSPLRPPFDTRQTQFLGSSTLSKLLPFVSFERHSRPLFKMFIGAFYSCNDVEAARKVVGILKVEERKNAVAKEARQNARSRGRIKATRKDTL